MQARGASQACRPSRRRSGAIRTPLLYPQGRNPRAWILAPGHYLPKAHRIRTQPLPNVIVDLDSRSLGERFAIIRAPRRSRARYPDGCVTTVADEASARAGADPRKHLHAAVVYGPSPSSEGQRIYYLVRWLD